MPTHPVSSFINGFWSHNSRYTSLFLEGLNTSEIIFLPIYLVSSFPVCKPPPVRAIVIISSLSAEHASRTRPSPDSCKGSHDKRENVLKPVFAWNQNRGGCTGEHDIPGTFSCNCCCGKQSLISPFLTERFVESEGAAIFQPGPAEQQNVPMRPPPWQKRHPQYDNPENSPS